MVGATPDGLSPAPLKRKTLGRSRNLQMWVLMKTESTFLGSRDVGDAQFPALIKVRLVHWRDSSLVIPDQVYLESPAVWFQPLTFLPCLLTQLESEITANIYLDVDGGETIRVDFKSSGLVARLKDGSYLYKATVHGPGDLPALGQSTWTMFNDRPYLQLFHHTTQANKDSIVASGLSMGEGHG